jgi:alcohol dehydrogenase, propanol-preferring
MKAMLLEKTGGPLVYTDVPDPVPNAEQVLLRVLACGVCRTDLHVLDGELAHAKPRLILGHEIIGEVIATGAKVQQFSIGERVGVPWLGWTCGECYYCQTGSENLCDNAMFTGYQIDGGYAELTVADQRYCFPVDKLYSNVHAAPLLCAGLIGYRALKMAGDAQELGIYGFGAAAHIVTQLAVQQGREVYAFTRENDLAARRCVGGGLNPCATQSTGCGINFCAAGRLGTCCLASSEQRLQRDLCWYSYERYPRIPLRLAVGRARVTQRGQSNPG